ncbi:toll/interleukin-1 receptor domain-containing protein [Streptomyces sp. 71268]|uniref:toll/interleukin-1 receptor domain-containing protein n=1 Tax=Streptomyces sp. 71268 TaxID=3002640 RepID=UPI0023F8B0D6|nr:toll/interleukin-1 receptor domain-containing protein [Streptomyces sp. 71268]WEV28213.1 toll/interleukin-1 receptor domain-containing protein [Streptomyces sp. 71268]
MTLIFLNYRQEGGAYAAALLDDLLIRRFGEGQVFRAARSICPGSDYADAILRAVAECEVMLAVIDEGWAASMKRQFDEGVDGSGWVLRELGEAFRYEKKVIPILLSGVERLSAEGSLEVPNEMSRLQYLRFDYRNIRQDVNFIAEQLVKVCPHIQSVRGEESRRKGLLGKAVDALLR